MYFSEYAKKGGIESVYGMYTTIIDGLRLHFLMQKQFKKNDDASGESSFSVLSTVKNYSFEQSKLSKLSLMFIVAIMINSFNYEDQIDLLEKKIQNEIKFFNTF